MALVTTKIAPTINNVVATVPEMIAINHNNTINTANMTRPMRSVLLMLHFMVSPLVFDVAR